MFIELDSDKLDTIVEDKKNVMVQFSAGWCGNCRIMKPKFKRFSSEYENYEFVIVDAEKFPQSRSMANVNNLPTFAAFKDGRLVDQLQTNKTDALKQFIDEITSN